MTGRCIDTKRGSATYRGPSPQNTRPAAASAAAAAAAAAVASAAAVPAFTTTCRQTSTKIMMAEEEKRIVAENFHIHLLLWRCINEHCKQFKDQLS